MNKLRAHGWNDSDCLKKNPLVSPEMNLAWLPLTKYSKTSQRKVKNERI